MKKIAHGFTKILSVLTSATGREFSARDEYQIPAQMDGLARRETFGERLGVTMQTARLTFVQPRTGFHVASVHIDFRIGTHWKKSRIAAWTNTVHG